jgi:hypothetical protein
MYLPSPITNVCSLTLPLLIQSYPRRRIYLTPTFYLFSCALSWKVHPLIPFSNFISLSYVWLSYFFFRAHYYFFRVFFPYSSLFFPLDHSYLPTSLLNCISFMLRRKSSYIFKFPAQSCHLCKYFRTTYFNRHGVRRKKPTQSAIYILILGIQ